MTSVQSNRSDLKRRVLGLVECRELAPRLLAEEISQSGGASLAEVRQVILALLHDGDLHVTTERKLRTAR
jgi:hypothetical protein